MDRMDGSVGNAHTDENGRITVRARKRRLLADGIMSV